MLFFFTQKKKTLLEIRFAYGKFRRKQTPTPIAHYDPSKAFKASKIRKNHAQASLNVKFQLIKPIDCKKMQIFA